MKRNLSRFFTLLSFIIASASAQATTTLNTIPEGLLSLDLPDTTSAQKTSYFSLPLTADPVYTGAVATSGVTATTISVADSPAPFANGTSGVLLGTLTATDEPYFVKFLSGAEVGRVLKITANTTSSLTLDTTDNSSQTTSLLTSGFAVAPGDTFEVFPAATLGSVFGANITGDPLVLHGAATLFTADSVSIYNVATVKFQTYFFNTTTNTWVLSGTTANANDTLIYPYSALVITRRSGQTALSVVPMARETTISSGVSSDILVPMSRVAEVAGLTKTTGSGHVVYGSTQYPVDMTLSQILPGANWVRSDSPFTADTISIWNATTSRFDTYYERLSDTQWRKVGDATAADQSSLVVPAGSAISILQRSSVTGSTSFLSSVMPYTLN